MGDVRISPVARAHAGFTVGCLLAVLGVGLLAGLGWALIAAGVLLAAASLVLVDVDAAGKTKPATGPAPRGWRR